MSRGRLGELAMGKDAVGVRVALLLPRWVMLGEGCPVGLWKQRLAPGMNDGSEDLSDSFFPPILVSPPSQEVPREDSKRQLLDEPREAGAGTQGSPCCSTAQVRSVS